MIRRPSDREMEARWRKMDYDMILWNLWKVIGDKLNAPENSKLTEASWDELPVEIREKIKDRAKARARRLERAR